MKSKSKLFIGINSLLILFLVINITPARAAVTLQGVSSARVGVLYTVTAKGIESNQMYAVVAAPSSGNLTEVIPTGSNSGTVVFIFESEDSDGIVPIQIWQYNLSTLQLMDNNCSLDTYCAALDTLIVNLDAPDQGLSTAFFVGILGGLLVIVIIVRVVRNLINST